MSIRRPFQFLFLFVVFTLLVGTVQLSFGANDSNPFFGRGGEPYGVKEDSLTFTPFFGVYWDGRYQFLPNQEARFEDVWSMGLRVGWSFSPYFELEAPLSFTRSQSIVRSLNVYHFGLEALAQYPLMDQLTVYALLGPGYMIHDLTLSPMEGNFALSYGAGLKAFIFRNLAFRPEARAITDWNDSGRSNTALMVTANLTYYFGLKPFYAKDHDGDGIPDHLDRCPNEPETKNSYQDDDGCPDVAPEPAEKVSEVLPTEVKEETISSPQSLDQDGDGIPDNEDQCPLEKEDFNNYFDGDGCPDAKQLENDRDRDGLTDDIDQCPDQREIFNSYRDEDGCPDHILESISGVLRDVRFQVGSAEIDPVSYPSLDRVAAVLREYPTAQAMLEGHTDNTGSRAINEKLSRDRALAVKEYLISQGVSAQNLSSQGYGPERPIKDNKTWLGRQENRRVELRILNPEAFPNMTKK